jgi:hypothetical protein
MPEVSQESSPEKFIDVAIAACRDNIARHSKAAILELTVALMILLVLLLSLYTLAHLQGEENDVKRQGLRESVNDANNQAQRDMEYYQGLVKQNRLGVGVLNKGAPQPVEKLDETKNALNEYKYSAERAIKALNELQAYKSLPLISDSMLYGAGALFVVLFGILTGLYRVHIREITKNEQYRLGFMRIRIAANNASTTGFDGEVRTTLTKGAFDSPIEESLLARRWKVESPLPGHPSSDLASSILNRLLEEVEVILQPKGKGTRD